VLFCGALAVQFAAGKVAVVKIASRIELTPWNWTAKESTSCDNSTGGVFLMTGKKGMTHYSKELKERAVKMFHSSSSGARRRFTDTAQPPI
jgi:hypothetical protein